MNFISIVFGDRPVRWSLSHALVQKKEDEIGPAVTKFIAHFDFLYDQLICEQNVNIEF